VSATSTITDLTPGSYTVTAANVVAGGTTYHPAVPTQQLNVTASTVAAAVTVAYTPVISTLVVGVIDAPQGASNIVHVTGPAGFSRTIAATTTFSNVAPGTYTVNGTPAITALGTWTALTPTTQRTLSPGDRDSVGVTY